MTTPHAYDYRVSMTWLTFLPLCTLLHVGSVEPGDIIVYKVHLIRIGWNWRAVLVDRVHQLLYLPALFTLFEESCLVYAKALQCMLFGFIVVLNFTFQLHTRLAHNNRNA